jgi:23S rRNA G2445 N2-methylase RlmL
MPETVIPEMQMPETAVEDPAVKFRALQQRRRRPKLSLREIDQAAELLGDADVKLRFFVGDLLVRQGKRGAEALLLQADSPLGEVRRSAVHVLGKVVQNLGHAPEAYGRIVQRLRLGLGDEDSKVRKNCAVSLGRLENSGNAKSLLEACETEEVGWVRTSLILALGASGGQETQRFLTAYQPRDSDESQVLRQAQDRSGAVDSSWSLRPELERPVDVEVLTFKGMEKILAHHLGKHMGLHATAVHPGVVDVHTARPADLYVLRPFRQLAFPLVECPCDEGMALEDGHLEKMVPALIQERQIFDQILAWHEGGTGVMRYRFEVRGAGITHPRRRALVRAWMQRLENADDRLRNSASHYDIEIRVEVYPDRLRLLVCPGERQDPRFAYRKKSIAASIEPAAAAALVADLPEGGPRVLDPFCGSGTLLAERGLARPAKALVGFDTDADAVRTARQNLSAAGLSQANILNQDMRRMARQGSFDEIIANMPFGIRVGNHAANETLYRDLFELLPAVLRPGSVVGLYTQEIKLTQALFAASSALELSRVRRFEVGGLKPAFFIGRSAKNDRQPDRS